MAKDATESSDDRETPAESVPSGAGTDKAGGDEEQDTTSGGSPD
jgi:hypothetical protein